MRHGLSERMEFSSVLIPAILTRRYKRFLADVVLVKLILIFFP